MTLKSASISLDKALWLRVLREAALIVQLACGVYLLLALVSFSAQDPGWALAAHQGTAIHNWMGPVGAWIASLVLTLIGLPAYAIPLCLLLYAVRRFVRQMGEPSCAVAPLSISVIRTLAWLLLFLTASVLATVHMPSQQQASAGGYLGIWLSRGLFLAFGLTGTTFVSLCVGLACITLATGLSWLALIDRLGQWALQAWDGLRSVYRRQAQRAEEATAVADNKAKLDVKLEAAPPKASPTLAPLKPRRVPTLTAVAVNKAEPKQRSLFAQDDQLQPLPAVSLLNQPQAAQPGYSQEALQELSRLLEVKLQDFGVSAQVVAVSPGPVITRFELQPAAGVKVSKISGLAKDLARSLAMVSVRVVEIIPGKSVIGIEVPNEHRAMVRLSQVLASSTYAQAGSALSLALGHDIAGNPVVADLARMPHLLVAGTTGSGKSVGVNAMLCSILFKATPQQVRMLLIDPKMLELSVYEGIPHLLTPVITDMKEAANGLRWCVAEMERRYKLMSMVGVRNLAGFNKKVNQAIEREEPIVDPLWLPEGAPELEQVPHLEPLPFIVVVIDEFADMMMIVGKKVEELIARIAQKARAAGIHLILATQRPSVDVITGLIKANVPTRIAFQVSSKIDSRTILDQGGAEQLLGHGDMLYMPPGSSLPERVHGAFVDDDEVHRTVAAWRTRGKPDYIEAITTEESQSPFLAGIEGEAEDDLESDTLFDEAVAFVTQSRKASISSVQRRFRIGYNRAARLIEAMEMAGIVTNSGHNGSREVLAPPPP